MKQDGGPHCDGQRYFGYNWGVWGLSPITNLPLPESEILMENFDFRFEDLKPPPPSNKENLEFRFGHLEFRFGKGGSPGEDLNSGSGIASFYIY